MKLSTVPIGKILSAIIVANLSRPNNFEILSPQEWKTICEEIKMDFPNLSYAELKLIILNGAKGKYNKNQFSINFFTIYKWIEMYLEIKKAMPKKELSCPKNIESFYWNQMGDRDRQAWKEKYPEQFENKRKNEGEAIRGDERPSNPIGQQWVSGQGR